MPTRSLARAAPVMPTGASLGALHDNAMLACTRAPDQRRGHAGYCRSERSALRSLATVVALVGLVSGCAWIPGQQGSSAQAERGRMERLVADDFAAAFAQLPETGPEAGTLAMNRPETPFGSALLVALRGKGYQLSFDNDAAASRQLLYQVESEENSFGTSLGYRVGVEGVSLSRDYVMKSTGVFPLSFMRVEGARADGLTLQDKRFSQQDPQEVVISGITPDASLPAAAGFDGTGGGEQTGFTPAGVADQVVPDDKPEGLPMIADIDGQQVVDKRRVELVNMRDTLTSNYSAFLGTYGSVETLVLVFPDDSLRVLPDARASLRDLQEQFNPATDVFSVIGCSHGTTNLEDGNRLLALGRSKRVLEELITLGVPDKLVLDEGCWAGDHFELMPPRGVVVELKRRGAG